MSEVDAQLHRDIGNLQARMGVMEQRQVESDRKLGEVHDAIMTAKGGWRMLLIVGTAGAAIGAALAKVLGWFIR